MKRSWPNLVVWIRKFDTLPRGYKTYSMLNSAEHLIYSANKYENANNSGIFIFIIIEIFMLSYV